MNVCIHSCAECLTVCCVLSVVFSAGDAGDTTRNRADLDKDRSRQRAQPVPSPEAGPAQWLEEQGGWSGVRAGVRVEREGAQQGACRVEWGGRRELSVQRCRWKVEGRGVLRTWSKKVTPRSWLSSCEDRAALSQDGEHREASFGGKVWHKVAVFSVRSP